MNFFLSTWLLVIVSSTTVLGASLNADSKATFAAALHNLQAPVASLNRQTRSLLDGLMPCVGIGRLTELKHQFNSWFDHNDDGKATAEETKEFLRRFKDNVRDEAVSAFIARRDTNGNGVIDFVPEYVQFMVNHDRGEEGAKEWFQIQDNDENGFISVDELVRQGIAMGLPLEEAEASVHGYYMMMDDNNDGRLSFEEFKQLFSK